MQSSHPWRTQSKQPHRSYVGSDWANCRRPGHRSWYLSSNVSMLIFKPTPSSHWSFILSVSFLQYETTLSHFMTQIICQKCNYLLSSRHRWWLSVVVAAPGCVCLLRWRLYLERDTEGSSPLQHTGLRWARCGCGGSSWCTSQDYQVLDGYFFDCVAWTDLTVILWPISHRQVLHRWRPVLEVLQLHQTALLLCRAGIRARDQGHERQRLGLPAWGWWSAHVGGCNHWFPESHYKRVWVNIILLSIHSQAHMPLYVILTSGHEVTGRFT